MSDDDWMVRALELACRARDLGEVPIGAIVVTGDRAIGFGHNRTLLDCDPTGHAEIVALREAARAVGAPRLPEARIYVTLEPCVMCVGAIIQARLSRLLFGARDPKGGAVVSLHSLVSDPRLNHRILFEEGIRADRSRDLLQAFFRARR